MDKATIIRLINQQISEQNLSVDSLSIASHTHNGSDSVQIQSNNIDTLNGFTFGTKSQNVLIKYDVATKTFVIVEQGTLLSSVPLQIGSFSKINILASGTGVGDDIALFFNPLGSTKVSALGLTSTASTLYYTTGVGTNLASINLTSADFNVRVDNGTDKANMELTPNIFQLSNTGSSFVVQIPATLLPTPVAGMIAFDGSDFRGVDSSGTWRTFTLV